ELKETRYYFFFSSRRRHTRSLRDWSSDVCSSDLLAKTKSNSKGINRKGRRGRKGNKGLGNQEQKSAIISVNLSRLAVDLRRKGFAFAFRFGSAKLLFANC